MDDVEQFIRENNVAFLNILTELDPYLSALKEMPINSKKWMFFKEVYAEFIKEKEKQGNKVRFFSKGLLQYKEKNTITTQWFQWYLSVFEGINSAVLNTLIVLINSTKTIQSGTPDNTSKKIVKAKTLQDLKKGFIAVNAKNSYLAYYGLNTIVCMVNTQTRNDIAHVNYDIKDNDLYLGDERAITLVIKRLTDLLRLLMVIDYILKGIIIQKESAIR